MVFSVSQNPADIVSGLLWSFLIPIAVVFFLDFLRQKQKWIPKLSRHPNTTISWASQTRTRAFAFIFISTILISATMFVCMRNLRHGSTVFLNPRIRNRQCFSGQDDPEQVCNSNVPTYKKYLIVLIDGWAWDSTLPTFDLFTSSNSYNLYRIMCQSFRVSTSAYTTLLTGLLPMNFDAQRATTDSLLWQLKYSAGFKTRFYGPDNPMRLLFDHNDLFSDSVTYTDEKRSFEELFGAIGETRTKEQVFAALDKLAEGMDGVFLNSILLDHLQHRDHSPDGPGSSVINKMLNEDSHWFKDWIDSKNGEYVLALFSDHGSPHDNIVLHGPAAGGNENWLLMYAPNLVPERDGNYHSTQDWIDILDVAATMSQYIEGVNIPADSLGTIKPRTNDPEERARLLHRNAMQIKMLADTTDGFEWNKHLYSKAQNARSDGNFEKAEHMFTELIAQAVDPIVTLHFPKHSLTFLSGSCIIVLFFLHNYDYVQSVNKKGLDGQSSRFQRVTFFWRNLKTDIVAHFAFGLWVFCFIQFSANHRFFEKDIYQGSFSKLRILLAFATFAAAHTAFTNLRGHHLSKKSQSKLQVSRMGVVKSVGNVWRSLPFTKPSYSKVDAECCEMEELTNRDQQSVPESLQDHTLILGAPNPNPNSSTTDVSINCATDSSDEIAMAPPVELLREHKQDEEQHQSAASADFWNGPLVQSSSDHVSNDKLLFELSTYRSIGWAVLLAGLNGLIVDDFIGLSREIGFWVDKDGAQHALQWCYFLGFCSVELWDRLKMDKKGRHVAVKVVHFAHTLFSIFMFNHTRATENSGDLDPLHVVYWGSIAQFAICFFGPQPFSRAALLPCVTLAYPLIDGAQSNRSVLLGLIVPILFALSFPRLCAGVKSPIRRCLISLLFCEAFWSFGTMGQRMGLDVNPNIPGMVRPEDEPYLSVFLMGYRQYSYFVLAGVCLFRLWERNICDHGLDGAKEGDDQDLPTFSAIKSGGCECWREEDRPLHHFSAVYLSCALVFATALSGFWFVFTMWSFYEHYTESFFACFAVAACSLLAASQILLRYVYAILRIRLPIVWRKFKQFSKLC